MQRVTYGFFAAALLGAAAFSDTIHLTNGTALDGEVSRPNDASYTLTVGDSSITFPATDVVKVEKNDKRGNYDLDKANPLTVQHLNEMQDLTGLTEEQKEEVQSMLYMLGSEDPMARQDATKALIAKGQQVNIVKFLQVSASASTATVASGILDLLVTLDPKAAKETLRERASDMEPEVRAKALLLMGKTKDSEGLKTLASGLKDYDSTVRISAAEGLGHAGDKRASQVLVDNLSSPDRQLQNACITALQRIWSDDKSASAMTTADEWKRYWDGQSRKVKDTIAPEDLDPLVEKPEGGTIIRG